MRPPIAATASVLFERTPQAQGASIRNFGMIWPIGQAPDKIHQRALATRQTWLDLALKADIWLAQTGSLHLAYADDRVRRTHRIRRPRSRTRL